MADPFDIFAKRQLLVWRVVDSAVDKTDLWNVAMIITMAASEVAGEDELK